MAALDVKIARGLGGVREARAVRRMLARIVRYERALSSIVDRGDAKSAAIAREALGRRG